MKTPSMGSSDMDNMPPKYNYNAGSVQLVKPTENQMLRNRLKVLTDAVERYLRLGSCDGRVERKALRKELATLIGVEYDEKESRIK